ncbi:hypothetical protein YC2023_013717 [Brassica napus]
MLSTCWGKKKGATKASESITAPKLFSIRASVDPDSPHVFPLRVVVENVKGLGTVRQSRWGENDLTGLVGSLGGRTLTHPKREGKREEAQTFLWTNHVSSHPPVYIHRSKRSKRGPPKGCGTMTANFSLYSINIVKASQTRTSLGVVMKLSVSCLTSKHTNTGGGGSQRCKQFQTSQKQWGSKITKL